MLSYRNEWTEETRAEAKKTICGSFNGEAGFKLTYDEETHKVTVSKDGISFPLNFESIGYSGSTLDINVGEGWAKYKTIGRISPKSDLWSSRLTKEFREYAQSKLNQILEEQITKPSQAKNQVSTEKAFAKWKKDNEKYLGHKIINEVELEQNWSGKQTTSIGLDRLITKISTYEQGIPSLTQIFGIIVQSGIKVHSVGHSIEVIGNGEETSAFIKLIDNFLEWKF